MKTITLVLPMITPSRNKQDRTHFQVRKREREDIGWLLKIAGAYDEKWRAGWKEVRAIKIISYRKRLIDFDNFVAGMKDLIDCLEDAGIIFTDSPKYLIHQLHEQRHPEPGEEERTVIRITIFKDEEGK